MSALLIAEHDNKEVRLFTLNAITAALQIDQDLNVYPKMAFGKEFGSMEPDVLPDQMEGT